jgi:hypothetical protein
MIVVPPARPSRISTGCELTFEDPTVGHARYRAWVSAATGLTGRRLDREKRQVVVDSQGSSFTRSPSAVAGPLDHAGGTLGTIPFLLRVGIVGERRVDDPEVLRGLAAVTLRDIGSVYAPSPETGLVLCVVSSLEFDAERVVAGAILDSHGATLEVGLRLPRAQTLAREQGRGREELAALLSRALVVTDGLAMRGRTGCPDGAARWVFDRSDVVIVLEEERQLPPSTGSEQEFSRLRVTGPPVERTRAAVNELADYNRASLRCPDLRGNRFGHAMKIEADRLPQGRHLVLAGWILPYFVRADKTAVRYERRFNRLVAGEFLLAATAVLIAGYTTVFTTRHPRLALFELVALASVVALVVIGRWSKTHRRWLEARFLAERFRSAYFLKLAGLDMRRGHGFEGVRLAEQSEEWLRRAYTYVWYAGQPTSGEVEDREELRRTLADGWIRPQIDYHYRRSAANRTRYRIITAASLAVFLLTAVAVLLPNVGVDGHVGRYLVVASIALPAFGSALVGIATHRQYQRHAAIYRRTAQYLAEVLDRIESEPSLEGLRYLAAEADEIMSDENRDWLGAMRFHNFDLAR